MPKRVYNDEWVGQMVLINSQITAQRRWPDDPMKIIDVNRQGRKYMHVTLECDGQLYKDKFEKNIDPSTRYARVPVEAVPFNPDKFRTHPQELTPVPDKTLTSIEAIIPPFQCAASNGTPIRIDNSTPQDAIAVILACGMQPFGISDIFRVSCQGVEYENHALANEANVRKHRDKYM